MSLIPDPWVNRNVRSRNQSFETEDLWGTHTDSNAIKNIELDTLESTWKVEISCKDLSTTGWDRCGT